MALKVAMNTMTFSLRDVDIPSIAEAISRAGFTGIDLRDSHIQDYLQAGHSMQEIKNLLKEYKLHPIAIHALRDWQKAEDKKGEKYWESVEQYFDMSRKMNCEFSVCAALGPRRRCGWGHTRVQGNMRYSKAL